MLFDRNIGLLRLVPGQAKPIAKSRGKLVHPQREARGQPDAPGPVPALMKPVLPGALLRFTLTIIVCVHDRLIPWPGYGSHFHGKNTDAARLTCLRRPVSGEPGFHRSLRPNVSDRGSE